MRFFIIVSVVIFFQNQNVVYSQGNDTDLTYNEYVKKANIFYKEKKYQLSGNFYNKAFRKDSSKIELNDRYNAACSWALSGNVDSTFIHLFKIGIEGNFKEYNSLTKDSDFKTLYIDYRWGLVERIVRRNLLEFEKNFNKSLIAILDSIYQSDQDNRFKDEKISNKYGWGSDEAKKFWKVVERQDSLNLIKIDNIIRKHGWLGADIIGREGNQTLFLVIQHSNQTVQEKYLPIMREAVSKGNANPQDLALLEDRVALGQGKKQIYGSQLGIDQETKEFYVLPLKDPDNVDKRRAEIGLQPIAQYLINSFELVWDVEEYKKRKDTLRTRMKK